MVSAWTADDPAEVSRLVKLGVTAVITNRPDAVAEALYEGLEP
jgi:glycerophosphoryl diester phosphodiesterase